MLCYVNKSISSRSFKYNEQSKGDKHSVCRTPNIQVNSLLRSCSSKTKSIYNAHIITF
mgnify:CR=1 FL=1